MRMACHFFLHLGGLLSTMCLRTLRGPHNSVRLSYLVEEAYFTESQDFQLAPRATTTDHASMSTTHIFGHSVDYVLCNGAAEDYSHMFFECMATRAT